MTECNNCGRCCDPVVLPYTQDDIRHLPPFGKGSMFIALQDPENRRWILEDLIPIRRRDGVDAVADYMSAGAKTAYSSNGEAVVLFSHFFKCKWYNKEERTCEAYDRRPPICSGYPWYGDEPDETKAIPKECSYNADVGVPVKLITKP